jgi:hypothetical protein
MDWNRRDHARKFLKATGRYIADTAVDTAPFASWGEWEPSPARKFYERSIQ